MGTDGIIAKPNISGTLEFSQFLSVFNRASGFSWSDAPRGFAGEPITGWTLDSLWFPIFQLAWKFHHQIHILDKFEGFSVYTSNLETINLGRKIVQIHFQCIESECGLCFNEGFTLTKYQRNIDFRLGRKMVQIQRVLTLYFRFILTLSFLGFSIYMSVRCVDTR